MGAGILHTIVFHRALGLVRPKDIDLELFEITYVSDPQLLSLVDIVVGTTFSHADICDS